VIEVPRSLLAEFLAMEQSSQVGVYALVWGRNYLQSAQKALEQA
jgi:hypothetical protein